MNKPELLAPAGGERQLMADLRFGADAVYLGGQQFGLRAFAGNFDDGALTNALRAMHAAGKKVYVTVNAFLYDRDLDACAKWLYRLQEMGADAAIVTDPATILLARREAPKLKLHLSTQANTLNGMTASFWHEQGVERVILARELGMEDIRALRAATPADLVLESFVHGAMCASYSGRCVLSNILTGRDANQGQCAQACRWKYALVEEKRPGEYLPVFEDSNGTYIYSANDLCMIEHLRELYDTGVRSFKIEGRMKTDYYVATVVSAYRRAIDAMLEHPEKPFDPALRTQVEYASHRTLSTGFYYTKTPLSPPGEAQYEQGAVYVGRVLEQAADGGFLVEQKNKFSVGEALMLFTPHGYTPFTVDRLCDADTGEALDSAPHPEQRVRLALPKDAQPHDILIRVNEARA